LYTNMQLDIIFCVHLYATICNYASAFQEVTSMLMEWDWMWFWCLCLFL
jgi:hypothetical protein